MRYDRIILGYHGCDANIASDLLDGVPFKKSINEYDWLGTGVYFWEYGPERANQFAVDQVNRGKVKKPAVVGAIIQLGHCFDLMDTRFTEDLGSAFQVYRKAMKNLGVPIPVNKGKTPDKKLRNRDCAVLNFYLEACEREGKTYQTVRGCFVEGGPAFTGSKIYKQSHIQISVRDLNCILGVFRP